MKSIRDNSVGKGIPISIKERCILPTLSEREKEISNRRFYQGQSLRKFTYRRGKVTEGVRLTKTPCIQYEGPLYTASPWETYPAYLQSIYDKEAYYGHPVCPECFIRHMSYWMPAKDILTWEIALRLRPRKINLLQYLKQRIILMARGAFGHLSVAHSVTTTPSTLIVEKVEGKTKRSISLSEARSFARELQNRIDAQYKSSLESEAKVSAIWEENV